MLEILLLIIVSSLTCIGVTIATQEWYVGYPIRQYLESIFIQDDWSYHWMYAPLLGCHTCMASLRSFSIYILLMWASREMVTHLLVIIPSVATLNTLLRHEQ